LPKNWIKIHLLKQNTNIPSTTQTSISIVTIKTTIHWNINISFKGTKMKQILILLLISAANIFASIGEITAVHGKAELHRGSETKQIITGTKLEKHDIIHTGKNSKLQIVFNDKTVISL
jgi:hypothetical protein